MFVDVAGGSFVASMTVANSTLARTSNAIISPGAIHPFANKWFLASVAFLTAPLTLCASAWTWLIVWAFVIVGWLEPFESSFG